MFGVCSPRRIFFFFISEEVFFFSLWAPEAASWWGLEPGGRNQAGKFTIKLGSFHLPTADSSASYLGKCDPLKSAVKVPGDTGVCNMHPNLCHSQEVEFKFAH